MNGKATFVKQNDGRGDGRIYKLDPPLTYERGGDTRSADHVWVSAVVAMFSGPETYIFACDEDGEVTDWGELEGSFRGALDHEAALNGAGYEVVA